MQGWRISMEDAHAAVLDLQPEGNGKQQTPAPPEKRMAYFGVYDGHGGEKVAQFAGENIHKIVAKQEGYSKGDIESALKDGFLATDRAILSGRYFSTTDTHEGPWLTLIRFKIRGRSIWLHCFCWYSI